MTIQESETLNHLHLSPGDRIRVTTEVGTIYDIEAHDIVAGLLHSTVFRRPVEKPGLKVAAETYEQAHILSRQAVGRIAVGDYMEVIALNSHNDRVDFRTTPVQTIAYLDQPLAA